jgi:hypothetical protein
LAFIIELADEAPVFVCAESLFTCEARLFSLALPEIPIKEFSCMLLESGKRLTAGDSVFIISQPFGVSGPNSFLSSTVPSWRITTVSRSTRPKATLSSVT